MRSRGPRAASREPAGVLGACALLLVGACGPPATAPAADTAACPEDGELVADVYGGFEGRLDWRGSRLDCEGMRRPHGRGARLRFAGPAADDDARRLAFIIALPDLERGATGRELPASVTLMAEDAGRFFSTPEDTGCWADIDRHDRLQNGGRDDYGISGRLYCVSPLAEVNGTSSVSLRDFRFTGRLSWADPP